MRRASADTHARVGRGAERELRRPGHRLPEPRARSTPVEGPVIRRIISGGQAGADRAALDAARDADIETGGWVPRGRWAEDGTVPDCYPNMKETCSADPAIRTECNVRDSDATVVFHHGDIFGGTRRTVDAGGELGRPVLCLDLSKCSAEVAAARLLDWASAEGAEVLNVAGPRQSEDGDIYSAARAVLDAAFRMNVSERET